MKDLENKIKEIEKRNKRVEADKAWETSLLRKSLIMILTYIVVLTYSFIADTTNPYLSAVVPVVGFFLSTQSLNIIKKKWIKRKFYNK